MAAAVLLYLAAFLLLLHLIDRLATRLPPACPPEPWQRREPPPDESPR